MTLETKAAYARRHGVSKPAVGKWAEKGWLVLVEGKVDVEASDANLGRYRDTTDGRAAAASSKPVNPAVNPVVNEPARPDETPEEAAERIVLALGADMDFQEAKRVKENYLALLQKLEYEKKAGALVELEMAKGVLFEAARENRNAWIRWPSDIGPLLAADLGLEPDRVVEALTAHVHKHLSFLGEPSAGFDKGR